MTVLLTHHLDGTPGSVVNATAEGYAGGGTSTLLYQSGGVSGNCARFNGNNGANELYDTSATAIGDYQGFYLRVISAPSAAGDRMMVVYTSGATASAYISINTDLTLSIGSPWSNVDTTTAPLTANTWYWISRHVDLTSSTQELRLYDSTKTTLIDTLTGACRNNSATVIDKLSTGILAYASTGLVFDVDEVVIADDWPPLTTAPAGPTVRGVIVGGVEVPASVRGVIVGGVEVAANVKEVVGGSAPADPTVVTFSDFSNDGLYMGLNLSNTANQTLIGDGVTKTTYEMVAGSSTKASYVAGLTSGQTNQCRLIFIGGRDSGHTETGIEVGNFTLQGTDQGHIYNGLVVGYSTAASVHDLKIADVPGNDVAPPGETFGLSMWHANNSTIDNLTIDGGNIAATLLGLNTCNTVTITNSTFVNSGYAMPTACWESQNVTFDGCTFTGANRGINIENPYGGYHTFKNCTFGKYTNNWQINIQGGVWVAADANTKSTVLTIEDPVWDFAANGPIIVRHFPQSSYPQNVQLDSDIHLVIGGMDVTSDTTKFKFVSA